MSAPGNTAAPSQSRRRQTTAEKASASSWQPTRLINLGRSLAIFRARPASDRFGPGVYTLKMAASEDSNRTLAMALLRREATVAAEVANPHLLSVLVPCLQRLRPYTVLPYQEGITLRRRLLAAPLPVSTALWIVRQITEALGALHAAGWLHGQVRPEHIILSPQGHATLIDLTEARRLQTAECDAEELLPKATAYGAPESFSSRGRMNAATDLYSLGIVLYEALTGKLPFDAADPCQLAALHRREATTDVRWLRPGVSPEIAELVQRMLAKDSLRRPSDEDLVRWLTELEIAELGS